MSRWSIVDKSLDGRQGIYFPHYTAGRCPNFNSSPSDVLRYRQKKHTLTSPREQARIKQMCSEDFLFYLCTFVWIFQSKGESITGESDKKLGPRPVPFIPYEFQEECFTVMWKCLHDEQEDLRIKKPRDVGATYMVVSLFEHAWHFIPHVQLLLGSRKKEEVDGTTDDPSGATPTGDWSKLMAKVDFIHTYQPRWLLPNGYAPRTQPFRTSMKISNPELGGGIFGESANSSFGRGRRYYGIGFDEHAHTEHAYEIIGSSSASTDCHFWWSSPAGPATAFAMLGRSNIRQISLDWWMHPLHAQGMTLDPKRGDRGRSSPWFEKAMDRIGHDPVLANNEIWADESQSGGCYYANELFGMLLDDDGGTVLAPTFQGELDFSIGKDGPWPTRWMDQMNGCWQLWFNLDSEGNPPKDERYILGADVAAGTTDSMGRGCSNSTIAVIGEYSRSKVAEFATHGLPVHKFAMLYLAAARWFCGSERRGYMIWDAKGPGGTVASVVVDDYDERDNMYWRVTSKNESLPGYARSAKADRNSEPWGAHVKMLWEGGYLERSRNCVGEMRFFNHNPAGGAPVHSASKSTEDPSGARENHGDRMTATVLACIELLQRKNVPRQKRDIAPFGSVLHMEQKRKKRYLQSVRI